MSCLCENESLFLEREVVDEGMFGWAQMPMQINKILYTSVGVLIDKRDTETYLRLVQTDDYGCLEAGEKIEIKFCPFCGKKLN
jgi:hypothetical protein